MSDSFCQTLLHVVPPFGNRILNNSWAVGLTLWIIYLIFLCFDICNYICLGTSDFSVLPSQILSILSSSLVLTSSIDVVFILSTVRYFWPTSTHLLICLCVWHGKYREKYIIGIYCYIAQIIRVLSIPILMWDNKPDNDKQSDGWPPYFHRNNII